MHQSFVDPEETLRSYDEAKDFQLYLEIGKDFGAEEYETAVTVRWRESEKSPLKVQAHPKVEVPMGTLLSFPNPKTHAWKLRKARVTEPKKGWPYVRNLVPWEEFTGTSLRSNLAKIYESTVSLDVKNIIEAGVRWNRYQTKDNIADGLPPGFKDEDFLQTGLHNWPTAVLEQALPIAAKMVFEELGIITTDVPNIVFKPKKTEAGEPDASILLAPAKVVGVPNEEGNGEYSVTHITCVEVKSGWKWHLNQALESSEEWNVKSNSRFWPLRQIALYCLANHCRYGLIITEHEAIVFDFFHTGQKASDGEVILDCHFRRIAWDGDEDMTMIEAIFGIVLVSLYRANREIPVSEKAAKDGLFRRVGQGRKIKSDRDRRPVPFPVLPSPTTRVTKVKSSRRSKKTRQVRVQRQLEVLVDKENLQPTREGKASANTGVAPKSVRQGAPEEAKEKPMADTNTRGEKRKQSDDSSTPAVATDMGETIALRVQARAAKRQKTAPTTRRPLGERH